jgi:2-oxoglutarate ferredoxin oxidoreductase subunit gamma
MEERILIAGAGGQGALTLGKFVAQVAMEEHRVTFFPSYGAEVRGGTAHCHVVISDTEIADPVVEEATAMIVMNQASYARFAPRIRPDGLLVTNSSMVRPEPHVACGQLLAVPASQRAAEMGDIRVANIILLGAMNAARPVMSEMTLRRVMGEKLGGDASKAKLLELNRQALELGIEFGKSG